MNERTLRDLVDAEEGSALRVAGDLVAGLSYGGGAVTRGRIADVVRNLPRGCAYSGIHGLDDREPVVGSMAVHLEGVELSDRADGLVLTMGSGRTTEVVWAGAINSHVFYMTWPGTPTDVLTQTTPGSFTLVTERRRTPEWARLVFATLGGAEAFTSSSEPHVRALFSEGGPFGNRIDGLSDESELAGPLTAWDVIVSLLGQGTMPPPSDGVILPPGEYPLVLLRLLQAFSHQPDIPKVGRLEWPMSWFEPNTPDRVATGSGYLSGFGLMGAQPVVGLPRGAMLAPTWCYDLGPFHRHFREALRTP